ncbi:unnamed protein product, partial [Polarella glacialis]
ASLGVLLLRGSLNAWALLEAKSSSTRSRGSVLRRSPTQLRAIEDFADDSIYREEIAKMKTIRRILATQAQPDLFSQFGVIFEHWLPYILAVILGWYVYSAANPKYDSVPQGRMPSLDEWLKTKAPGMPKGSWGGRAPPPREEILAARSAEDVVLAFALERRARHRYKVFVNLMWIIICLCVLVCGTFLSVYVIGKWEEDSGWAPTAPDQLADLLPSNDTSLRSQGVWPTSWANGAKSVADDEFTSLGDQLFFSAADGKGRRALWRSNSSKPATLVAPGMLDAHSFTFVGPDVFFFAKDYETFRNPGVECLWMIAAARPASGATLVKEFESGTQLLSMFVDILSSTPLFYFKVYRRCSGLWGYTLFQSSGNTSGTVDLDASANCDVTPVGREGPYARPPTTRLASELFLA